MTLRARDIKKKKCTHLKTWNDVLVSLYVSPREEGGLLFLRPKHQKKNGFFCGSTLSRPDKVPSIEEIHETDKRGREMREIEGSQAMVVVGW